jgi:hypothetical protein
MPPPPIVVDPVGSAMTGTGPVVTKHVNKATIIIASIVVFMKALLLLVEVRRSTHSLAIWLIQSVTNGGKPAPRRSRERPASAAWTITAPSAEFFSLLPVRCLIHHLSTRLVTIGRAASSLN